MYRRFCRRISLYLYPIMLIGMCLLLTCCRFSQNKVNEVPNFWKAKIEDCWPCAVYGTTFEVLTSTLKSAIPFMCSISLMLLTIGLSFFILTKIGGALLTVDKSYPKVRKELVHALLKAVAVAIMLNTADTFYGFFIGQILQPISAMILQIADILLHSSPSLNVSAGLRAFDLSNAANALSDSANGRTVWNGAENVKLAMNVFGDMPYQIQTLVFRIYTALRNGVGVAIYIINKSNSLVDFFGFVAALFLLFYSFELTIVVPCIFLDSFFRLAIAIILLPLLLVSWVFEGASKLLPQLKSVVPLVLKALLDIVFGCMFVVVMSTTLQVYTDGALNHAWTNAITGYDLATTAAAKALSINFVVLIILIVAFRQLAEKIGDISAIYGGGGATSAWNMYGKVKKTVLGLGKSAVMLTTGAFNVVAAPLKGGVAALRPPKADELKNNPHTKSAGYRAFAKGGGSALKGTGQVVGGASQAVNTVKDMGKDGA